MKLRDLERVGRHWVNADFVVRIDDLARPESPGEEDEMGMVTALGDRLTFRGDDAAELRRLLAGADAGEGDGRTSPDAAPPSPNEKGVLSGSRTGMASVRTTKLRRVQE